jgi:hypothetical protein
MRNGEKAHTVFETNDHGVTRGTVSFAQYQNLIFDGYDDTFNNYTEYDPATLSVYTFPMPEAADPSMKKFLDLLAAHLSKDEGVVRFRTGFAGEATGSVYFDAAKTDTGSVSRSLRMKQLTYFVSDTQTEQTENPFHLGLSSGSASTLPSRGRSE